MGWPPTLLAMLANTLGMSSLLTLVPGGVVSLRRVIADRRSARVVLTCTAVDFASGCLLTTGLLTVGGGLFVLVYSSTTVWTALWARASGERLSAGRWAGVLLVFCGMAFSSGNNVAQAAAEGAAAWTRLLFGIGALLVGTMLHAAMFVLSEAAMARARIDLCTLCGGMGAVESTVLLAWNGALLVAHGPGLYAPEKTVGTAHAGLPALCMLYAGLALVNGAHALAFFHLLRRVGAVSSAVLKGVQLLLVFAASVLFFCRFQPTQCFSWPKAAGVGVVAAGLVVYARAAPSASAASDSSAHKNDRATIDG